MVLSVGTNRENAFSGPSVNTDFIAIYNYIEENVEHVYEIKSDAYIVSVVLYNDGILYADYSENKGIYEWVLKFTDGSKMLELDHGTAAMWDAVPQLFYAGDAPCYLWENSSVDYTYGINRIVDMQSENIFTECDYYLCGYQIYSNGHEYCYMVRKNLGDERAIFTIGNADGVKQRHKLSGKITSFAITRTHAICGVAIDNVHDEYFAEIIELQSGETSQIQLDSVAWRMKGMGDKYCVYVDDFYKPYYLDTNLMHVDTFELPKKVESSSWAIWAILFHSCQNSENLLVRFTSTAEKENTELFFLMYPQ